nr:uncharacterized protein LOC107771065 [Ipomoea batatas]GME06995.1 uncharacterized protein LOC107771065 [Ipomoea batatas]
MGNWWSATKEPPPLVVLVPPLFDFPPLAARTRMLESSYNLLFGKLALRCLFEDYFEEARHFSTRIMLRPIDDPHVDLIASLSEIAPKDKHPLDLAFVLTVSEKEGWFNQFPLSHVIAQWSIWRKAYNGKLERGQSFSLMFAASLSLCATIPQNQMKFSYSLAVVCSVSFLNPNLSVQ